MLVEFKRIDALLDAMSNRYAGLAELMPISAAVRRRSLSVYADPVHLENANDPSVFKLLTEYQ